MGYIVAQRLTQITPQLPQQINFLQHVEAACSAVPQEHTQSLFKSMPRRVAVVISNNGDYCCNFDPYYSPAATADQLWQRVEAACSAVPQELIQSLFESMPRSVAAVIQWQLLLLLILARTTLHRSL
ncbi:hypothetical protein TNCV_4371781 [Trichonephila clavipes]|nr:hypothetical protein TNCV_4371781 [Trichonephila clavipes]